MSSNGSVFDDRWIPRIISFTISIIVLALMTMAVRSCDNYNKMCMKYVEQGYTQVGNTWVKLSASTTPQDTNK